MTHKCAKRENPGSVPNLPIHPNQGVCTGLCACVLVLGVSGCRLRGERDPKLFTLFSETLLVLDPCGGRQADRPHKIHLREIWEESYNPDREDEQVISWGLGRPTQMMLAWKLVDGTFATIHARITCDRCNGTSTWRGQTSVTRELAANRASGVRAMAYKKLDRAEAATGSAENEGRKHARDEKEARKAREKQAVG